MPASWRRMMASPLLPGMLPAMLAIALFARTIAFGYVRWDDPQLITENPLVTGLSPAIFWSYDPELYIPITLLTYQIEYLVSGGAAWLAHAANIMLHAANAFLAWRLLVRLSGRPWAACMGALLFAAHPLTVEAVAWASGRKELLWTFWSLIAAEAYATGRGRIGVAGVALAALSKPTAVITPLLLRLAGVRWRTLWAACAAAAIAAAIAVSGKAGAAAALPAAGIAAIGMRSIVDVLRRTAWPTNLSPLYAVTDVSLSAALPSFLMLLIATGCAWRWRRSLPLAWTGAAWFLAALTPSLFTYMRSNEIQLAADRYAYMPLVGAAIAVTAIIVRYGKPAACIGIAALLAASWMTVAQTRLWSNSAILFSAAAARNPSSAVAWNNVGDAALTRGDLAAAEAAINRALELRPDYADALANMGAIRGRQERYDEAEAFLVQSLNLRPNHVQATFNLAGVLWKRGRADAALVAYRRVLELRPGFAPALAQVERLERERDAQP